MLEFTHYVTVELRYVLVKVESDHTNLHGMNETVVSIYV